MALLGDSVFSPSAKAIENNSSSSDSACSSALSSMEFSSDDWNATLKVPVVPTEDALE